MTNDDYFNIYVKIDPDINYPTITTGNIDTWNMITYGLIIQGMLKAYPDKKYGELMGMAENLTNTLFNALKTVKSIEKRIVELEECHKRKECDVLEGIDIGLLLIEEHKMILK